MKSNSWKKPVDLFFLTMEKQAAYRIKVLDRLDIGWSERPAGMRITTTGGKDIVSHTTLEGQVMDQSDLTGVLNKIIVGLR